MIIQKTVRSLQQTILIIIEDKPRYEIPLSVYKGIIFVSFFQILIYLFSDFQLQYDDEYKLQSVFQILDLVSIVNAVILKQDDAFSYVVYIMAMIFMIFYFLYVGCLTILKAHFKQLNEELQKVIQKINEILNLYLTLYLNVFLSFYLEINCSLIFCSKKSMLSDMRHQFYDPSILQCTIPTYQLAIGIFGLSLTIVTALLTNYYFRNYEFLEKNILKRKFTLMYFILTVLRVCITFVEFQWKSHNILVAKHVFAQIFGIVSIVDYFFYLPFTDQTISKYYLNVIAFYQSTVTCSNFYFLFKNINGNEMFYLTFLLALIFRAVLDQILNFKYDYIMQGKWQADKIVGDLDFYLEQIISLGQQSAMEEEAKTKLYKIYKQHQINCVVKNCVCKKYQQLNMRLESEGSGEDTQNPDIKDLQNNILDSGINLRLLYLFVDSIFKWMFSQKCITDNQNQFQTLSLKYISFMVKYQNNPIRAYQELKLLQLKNIQFSIFFEIISQIIEVNMQNTILNQQEIGQSRGKLSISQKDGRNNQKLKQIILHNELRIEVLLKVELLCQKYIPIFLDIIEEKQQLWNLLQVGYKDIDSFQKDSLKLMRKISQTRKEFQRKIQQVNQEMPDIEICIQFQKLIQIFYLFVVNDIIKANQVDQKINDLKKRDSFSEESQLKNSNLLKGEICLLEISIAENMGKILSKKDDKIAQFFGYNDKQDFLKINSINDLMPSHIGKVHNLIIKNFIKGRNKDTVQTNQIIQSFMKQRDGFIHPISVYFRFNFTSISSDFKLNGILLKEQNQKDFIIFDRTGKVTGISKNLAQNIFFEISMLPHGDEIIRRMNFLLIFPKIVKKITSFRDQILNDIQMKQSGNQQFKFQKNYQSSSHSSRYFLIDEHSSSTIITSDISRSFYKFMNFLNRNKSNSEYSENDKLDLLDKKCLSLLKQFHESGYEEQNTNRSNMSSDRRQNKQKKGDKQEQLSKEFSKFGTKSVKSNNYVKMKYNYSLQYRILDQESKKQTNSYKIIQNKKQNQKDDQQHKVNKQKDIYFIVSFHNIQRSQVHKKQKLLSAKDKFLQNLVDYFRSTTSIIPLSTNAKSMMLLNKQQSQLSGFQDDSLQNQNIYNLSTQIIDFVTSNQLISTQTELSFTQNKMVKHFIKNNQQSNKNKQRLYEDTDDQFQDMNQSSNQSSINVSYYSEDSNQGRFNEQQQVQKQIEKIIKNQNSFSDQIEDFYSFTQLDSMLQKYTAQKNALAQVDTNLRIKKILQNKSLSSTLSIAFEVAASEAIIQNEIHRQMQSQLKKADYLDGNEGHLQIYQPVTFRQGFDHQEFELNFDKTQQNNIKKKVEPPYNIQIQDYEQNLSFSNLDHLHLPSQILEQNFQELEYSNIATQMDNNQQDTFDTPYQIQKSNEQKQRKPNSKSSLEQNLLNISARPILENSMINQTQMQTDQIMDKNQSFLDVKRNQIDQIHLNQSKLSSGIQVSNQSIAYKQNNQRSQLDFDKTLNPSTDNLDYQKISLINSTEKQNNQDYSNQQDIVQENIIANIFNKKGIVVNGKNSIQTSVHSSRSSNSYAGFFLKDIIIRCKVPQAAKNYKLLLLLFIFVFFGLNITNLIVIQSDIKVIYFFYYYQTQLTDQQQVFSDNVSVLRYPRRFLRAYGKAFFGYYLQLQIQLGYLLDTPDEQYKKIGDDYIERGVSEYIELSQKYSTQLTSLTDQQIKNDENQLQQYSVYKNRQEQVFEMTKAVMYSQNLYYIVSLLNEKRELEKVDSFLYLRSNYFQFSQNVVDQVAFLINNTVEASNSLISKFTAIIIVAIVLIILIALISLPIIKSINFYEEKIIMILTRINFEQSEVEKTKYAICKQLINIELFQWMNYNYFDIFCLTCKTGNSNDQTNIQTSPLKIRQPKDQKKSKMIPKSKIKSKLISEVQSNTFQQSTIIKLNNGQESQVSMNQNAKNLTKREGQNNIQSDIINYSHNITSKQKLRSLNISTNSNQRTLGNQILSSRIQNQKLGVFKRFLTFFVLALINCIYYICIIVYLNESDDKMRVPIYMNQNSIELHAFQTNFKVALSLLSFDQYIKEELWSNYSIEDLNEYNSQVRNSFNQVQVIMQSITQTIYGDNPFSTDTVSQLKDIQEGRGCEYLQVYKCQSKEVLGLTQINANNQKFLNEYPNIFNIQKSEKEELKEYFNGEPYKTTMLVSFQQQDEIYDLYSQFINQSISQVSLSIQSFLQNYLIIGCVSITLTIFISEYMSWQTFFNRIQMMNLLLTMIPEEKLQEDVTLHMIRQLHRL